MRSNQHIDDILAIIDGVLPPEQPQPIQEVSGLLVPQFELIVALSGLEAVTADHSIDTHHLFWPRSSYKTTVEKQFRRSFQVPINRGVHNEVHAKIEPPTKPSRATMLGYLSLLEQKNGQQA
jgi:hypothetical protein